MTYGIDMEYRAGPLHAGPIESAQIGPGAPAAPTAACLMYVVNGNAIGSPEGWGINDITCIGGTITGPIPFVGAEISGSTFTLREFHCEDYVDCVRIGHYGIAENVNLLTIEPGIDEANGIVIDNPGAAVSSRDDITINGVKMTNTPSNALLVDNLVGPTCAVNTATPTEIVSNNFNPPSMAFYHVGNMPTAGTYRSRITSDYGSAAANPSPVAQCLTGAIYVNGTQVTVP